MILKFRDPVSALTHMIGAILSLIGLAAMLVVVALNPDSTNLMLVSALAFGIGLLALYSASFSYHAIKASQKIILRMKKLDHAMIFLLIAGSYTPFCLLVLSGGMRIFFMVAIWSIAVAGMLMMVFWIGMPRWLNTLLYIAMGWLVVFAAKPLFDGLSAGGITALLAGGLFYTAGGIMYGIKKPNLSPMFGFHEIFHIFVMLGSLCHYYAVFRYLLLPI